MDNKVLKTAKTFQFTGEYKDLYFRIRGVGLNDVEEIQRLCDEIWILPTGLQTSLIRELAKENKII